MATFALDYKTHWDWSRFDGDPYADLPGRISLTSPIHQWLSKYQVRHTLSSTGNHSLKITILDPDKAILFKLTWM